VYEVATTNYTVRIDEADRRQAERVFRALGMNLSTGINIYIKAVGRQQRVPFDLSLGEQTVAVAIDTKTSQEDKEKSFQALAGILAGHEVDLDKEREERISSK